MTVMPKTFIVMGVSGSGKSAIGDKLARKLGGVFEDADSFHPPSNLKKMTRGMPLTDEDRLPWLRILRERIVWYQSNHVRYILACSALKQTYRDLLRNGDSPKTLVFIYLKGTKELIGQRIEQRKHFMPTILLDSQFAILEEPEDAAVINIESKPDEIVAAIVDRFSTL